MKLSKKYGGLQFFAGTTGTVIFNFDTHIKKNNIRRWYYMDYVWRNE